MLATFTNTSTITVDLSASARHCGASAREFGSATVFVPRDSAAFATAYIDKGSLIELRDPLLPTWRGIVNARQTDERGTTLTALHLAKWLDLRPVSRNRVLIGYTAGAIVRQALMDGLVGLGRSVLRLGTFVEAAPHIDRYEFTGQSVYTVLTDMMAATGTQEWSISDDGAVSWVPRTGTLYAAVLCGDGDLINTGGQVDITEQTAEVVGIDPLKREYTARGDTPGYWPRVEVVTGATQTEAARNAEMVLAQKRAAAVTYTAQLLRSSAAAAIIRPGDFLQTVLPKADITPVAPLVRVLAIGADDTRPVLDLVLQNVPAIDSNTILRAFMEGGASAPPVSALPATDPTPAISTLRGDVADIEQRVTELEASVARAVPPAQLSPNLVATWNTLSGFDARHLTGGVAGDASNNALLAGASSTGGGVAVVPIKNATTTPASTPTGGGVLYVNAGALTFIGSSGTVTVIAPA